MAEEKKNAYSFEASIGLIVVVLSFIYIQDQLIRKHLIDVLIAVLAFGFGLVLLYRYLK